MAAGLGSRFGGLKQITPVGPSGEFILDYSIYDAIKAGFNKIIVVIKREMLEDFEDTIGKRIKDKIDIEYVFQDLNDIPENFKLPSDRTKPLGTGHALYAARKAITSDFAVISADDFYGRDAFFEVANDLKTSNDYSIPGFKLGLTLTDNGSVKRGVCFVENNYLTKIVESKITIEGDKIYGEPLDGSDPYEVSYDQPVTMLMYGFKKDIIPFMEEDIIDFFNNIKEPSTEEYLLPNILQHMMEQKGIKVKVTPTTSTWKGVTYKEDLIELQKYIKEQIEKGVYPDNLWR